jgi:hypothetical protein
MPLPVTRQEFRENCYWKVKLSLCLTKHHAMKTYWGSGGIGPLGLNLGLHRGKWLHSHPGRFTAGTHWMGGWVGPRAGLHAVRKLPCPCQEQNPGRPARSLVTIPNELPASLKVVSVLFLHLSVLPSFPSFLVATLPSPSVRAHEWLTIRYAGRRSCDEAAICYAFISGRLRSGRDGARYKLTLLLTYVN